MTAAEIARLKEIAGRATRGPWRWWTSNSWRRLRLDDHGITKSIIEPFVAKDGHPDCDVSEEDAAHIAAFDPPTALSLLTALEQSQAALAEEKTRVKELEEKLADKEFARSSWENTAISNGADRDAWERHAAALRARLEAAKEALTDATAHLVGAASAYRKYARQYKTRGDADPFFKTRAQDFDNAVDRARAAIAEMEGK